MNSFDGFKDEETKEAGSKSFGKRPPKKTKSFLPKNVEPSEDTQPIPAEAKLSKEKEDTSKQKIETHLEENPDILKNINLKSETNGDNTGKSKSDEADRDSKPGLESGHCSDDSSTNKLELMRERRKIIEKENKKKKELLAQTIATRKQRTNKEAEKLKLVQNELASIETELNVDVRFLMDAIQCASVDYTDAQKRYDRIEKEFIDAKVDLQTKSEKKELLMEHLATIIEQNEMRKAEKLAKIMEELGI